MLKLPQNFENDIQSRDTALVPVVVIKMTSDHRDNISISTNSSEYSKPLLLNIPSLKESIDIEKRNYKISSVNIDISNFPYEGVRFSDLVGDSSLINKSVDILWTSPNTERVGIGDLNRDGIIDETDVGLLQACIADNDCDKYGALADINADGAYNTTGDIVNLVLALGANDGQLPAGYFGWVQGGFIIYRGTVRRYTHDDEKVRLVVEDRSQATLHKDLPTANLGTGSEVPDKYKNKPIPMVYGHVDRSPCLFTGIYDAEYDFFQVSRFLIDSSPVAEKIETTKIIANKTIIETPLYLEDNGNTFNCASEGNALNDGTNFISYENTDPWIDLNLDTSIENSSNLGFAKIRKLREPIKAFPKYYGQGGDGEQSNRFTPPGGNDDTAPPAIPPQSDYIYDSDDSTYWILLKYGQTDEALVGGRNSLIYFTGLNHANFEAAFATLSFAPLEGDFDLQSKIFINFTIENVTSGDLTLALAAWVGEVVPNYNTVLGSSAILLNPSAQAVLIELVNEGELVDWNTYSGTDIFSGGLDITSILSTFNIPLGVLNFGIPFNTDSDLTSNSGVSIKDFIIKDLVLFQEGVSDNLNKYDFYANVNGRAVSASSPFPLQHPKEIISNILTEIGAENITYSPDEYYVGDPFTEEAWKYAFTVDKKINSKKLIEGIASVSPYIPRFDNMGNFKFDVIPMDGGTAGILSGDLTIHTIKEADVIQFSFSRTKIEDVYTKIEFKYNWDYARGEFNDSVEADTDMIEDYSHDYYGFKDDHSDSTLVIDDDRGKYIRNDGTAKLFADWYLMWSCNQHLKMKIKLPLKYMNLEIGDFVAFDAILGGVKPYGINYQYGGDVNHQTVFKNFLITSTNKTLEWVEIECIQMHNLDPDEDAVLGCRSSEACNYNADATLDDGSCVYGTTYYEDLDGDGLGNGNVQETFCDNPEHINYEEVPNGWVTNSDDVDDNCYSNVYDCFSTCDGNAIIDECGVCGGSGIPEGNCDCAGNVEDCAGVCGGSSVEDECGVCGGGGIPAGACDCAGNVNDECGECGGDGASVECSDGSYVCNEAMCGTDPDDFVMLWNEPYEIATTFVLDLSNSELTGEIPPEIGDLENLTHLDLSSNQLTGIIPPEIRDLTNLTHLDLSFNQLTGIIPPEIGDLTNLEVLNLGGNKVNGMGGLSGSIPHELAYLGNTSATGLTILWLFDNELSGDIPLTLGNLSSLTSLWLFNNELSGTIPWQIGADLTNLTNLDLSFNQLSGEIPLSIGYLADLTNLDLSFNQLSGEIPLSICDLTNLTIDLDNNQLCPHDFGTADAAYPSCIEDSVGSQDTSSCGECGAPPGDLNGDGGWNVIDIVTLANCAIANNCDELLCPNPSIPEECFYGCAGDVNGDGGYNVLDIVALANCILNNNCA